MVEKRRSPFDLVTFSSSFRMTLFRRSERERFLHVPSRTGTKSVHFKKKKKEKKRKLVVVDVYCFVLFYFILFFTGADIHVIMRKKKYIKDNGYL